MLMGIVDSRREVREQKRISKTLMHLLLVLGIAVSGMVTAFAQTPVPTGSFQESGISGGVNMFMPTPRPTLPILNFFLARVSIPAWRRS